MDPVRLLMIWFFVGLFLMILSSIFIFFPGINLTAGPYLLVVIVCINVFFFCYSIWNYFNQGDPCSGCPGYMPMRKKRSRRRLR